MAFKFSSDDSKHKILTITEDEFKEPIKEEYAKSLGQLTPAELYDNYNPGATLPDGGVNFECHCVSHLVASPCGYEFREAIKCQKAASEPELEEGACAEELMSFMRCVIRTECFRSRNDDDDDQSNDKSTTQLTTAETAENVPSSSNMASSEYLQPSDQQSSAL